MKLFKSSVLVMMLVLSGCASNKPGKGEIPTITSQTFNTNVPGEKIKIDKSCGWIQRDKCTIESIEATGVQPSVGATRLLQKSTTLVACDNARANVVGYVFGTSVNETADDANKDTNYSVREALINSDIDTVRVITTNAQGRLVGFRIKETNVIDSKTISCTILWNKNDSEDLKKVRGLISGQ